MSSHPLFNRRGQSVPCAKDERNIDLAAMDQMKENMIRRYTRLPDSFFQTTGFGFHDTWLFRTGYAHLAPAESISR
jgi:hypothetical protein